MNNRKMMTQAPAVALPPTTPLVDAVSLASDASRKMLLLGDGEIEGDTDGISDATREKLAGDGSLEGVCDRTEVAGSSVERTEGTNDRVERTEGKSVELACSVGALDGFVVDRKVLGWWLGIAEGADDSSPFPCDSSLSSPGPVPSISSH